MRGRSERGFSFADPYTLGQLFVGIALLAAVVALSQQHDRPFSPAMVYLVLGAVAAAIVRLIGVDWLDPETDAALIERLAEFAVDRPEAPGRTVGLWKRPTRERELLVLAEGDAAMPSVIGLAN